ncbi:uncharacterized protein BO97DRAFT_425291 [Aspergillus homomorphus CBS 101889]|uniref:Transmembrane protein n=1 Tax=Aspergillus homomorphus (strain CBS 101889) TaxID=1450537 RepID=A0A395HUY7_ASPHC|nr:hypothetical protein BO97DRAFT_425291 [Aspergillus homomorphus CBS 101889]RAL11627.1 hypothetical protein BO97DRAFT_425291 [Aspergillus homomorphus CBS 101889]
MSVSISFGSARPSEIPSEELGPTRDSEMYIPQTVVMGIFLAIFAAQMAINVIQIRRARQRGVAEGRRNANPETVGTRLPTEQEDEARAVDTETVPEEAG